MRFVKEIDPENGKLFLDAVRQGIAAIQKAVFSLTISHWDFYGAIDFVIKNNRDELTNYLITLPDNDNDRLEILELAFRRNHRKAFHLIARTMSDAKNMLSERLRQDNYGLVLSFFEYPGSIRHGDILLMEEIFEHYFSEQDRRNINKGCNLRKLSIICTFGSKKMLSFFTVDHELVLKDDFLLIRSSATNEHDSTILPYLFGKIPEPNRTELIDTLFHVAAKNDRVENLDNLTAIVSDNGRNLSAFYHCVRKNNYSLLRKSGSSARIFIINKINDENEKIKLFKLAVRWIWSIFYVYKIECIIFRDYLVSVLRNSGRSELITQFEQLIPKMLSDGRPYFSKEERELLHVMRELKIYDGSDRIVVYSLSPGSIDCYNFVNGMIKYGENEIVKITESANLFSLTKLYDAITKMLVSNVNYQDAYIRLPKSNPVEEEHNFFLMFGITMSKNISTFSGGPTLWCSSLDTVFGSKKETKQLYVNSIDIHAMLHACLAQQRNVTNNLALGHFGFVVSNDQSYIGDKKVGHTGRKFLSFPIKSAITDSLCVTTKVVDSTFHVHRERDMKKAEVVLTLSSDSNKEKGHYYHSEQAIFEYIESDENIQNMMDFLKSSKILPGYKIYAIYLDIISTRQMCMNCQKRAVGVQNSHDDGFLKKLQSRLRTEKMHYPKNGLFMVTRVSAKEAFSTTSLAVRGKTPDRDDGVVLAIAPPKSLSERLHDSVVKIISKSIFGKEENEKKEEKHSKIPEKFMPSNAARKYKNSESLSTVVDIKSLKNHFILAIPQYCSAGLYEGRVTIGIRQSTNLYSVFYSASKMNKKSNYCVSVAGQTLYGDITPVPGDGWCALTAAGFENPRSAIAKLMGYIGYKKDHADHAKAVHCLREAIRNNSYATALGERFSLEGADKNGQNIAAKIQAFRNQLQTNNNNKLSEKNPQLVEFNAYLEQPEVQQSYLKYILQTKYADPNLVVACMIAEGRGRRLAVFVDYGNVQGQLASLSKEDIDPCDPNTTSIVLRPGANPLLAHYDRFIVKQNSEKKDEAAVDRRRKAVDEAVDVKKQKTIHDAAQSQAAVTVRDTLFAEAGAKKAATP